MKRVRVNNNNNSIALIELFENIVIKTSNKIDSINFGGCGFFAYYLVDTLQRYGVKCTIARLEHYDSFNWWKKDFEKFKNLKRKKRGYDNLSASHFMAKVGKIYVDGGKYVQLLNYKSPSKIGEEVLRKHLKYRKITGYYTLEEMKIALEYGNWNQCYDRKQNTKLRKIIETECKKFFN